LNNWFVFLRIAFLFVYTAHTVPLYLKYLHKTTKSIRRS